MIIKHKLTMDLADYNANATVHTAQNDRYSRDLEIALLENGEAWVIPQNADVLIRYSKPDGTGGSYDALPDGRCAWKIRGNILTVALAPQVTTAPGAVRLSVTLVQEQIQISTFAVIIHVEKAVSPQTEESQDYYPMHGVPVEPAEADIPLVFFGEALPQTKDNAVMTFRYVSKTKDIRGYCKTKAQGNSSMAYPKKNQTVKLYRDADCTEKLQVNFKGWGPQNKFCVKANWIDLTHARNVVSAQLWADVVKSRQGYKTMPELLRTSPNQGAVDGFPVKVYAGGIYQGRYTLNIPKDAWMANMDEDLDNHCILCGENYESGCFRTEAVINESDWTDVIHDTVPDAIKARWNEAIRFVMNSSDEEFVSGIGTYFDTESLIDYYLFGIVSCGLDAFGKNQLYLTYDGQTWYASMYDMDSTWGLWWDGASFVDTAYSRAEYQDFKDGSGNLLYIRLEALFRDAIKTRWETLKDSALSISNILSRFERFINIAPEALVKEDYAGTTANGVFTGIPSQSVNNLQQIRSYAASRLNYCSNFIMTLGTTESYTPLSYIESSGDQYIDTGISGGTNAAYEMMIQYNDIQPSTYDTVFAGVQPSMIPKVNYLDWVGFSFDASTGYAGSGVLFADKTITGLKYNSDGTVYTKYGSENWKALTIDSSSIAGNGWGDLTWYLFASHGEADKMIAVKLFYLKMYTDGVLVRDFIPVMRDADSTYGLYDKVTQTFFPGTGGFTGSK